MRRSTSLLACGALVAAGTAFVLPAGAAVRGGQAVPATITAEAAFECTDEAVTVEWTLTVESEENQVTEIIGANASPDHGDVTFTPATGLGDGDTSTGTSTHPPDTTDVALVVDYFTSTPGSNDVPAQTTAELPVECPPEEPPPAPEEPPVVEPSFTG